MSFVYDSALMITFFDSLTDHWPCWQDEETAATHLAVLKNDEGIREVSAPDIPTISGPKPETGGSAEGNASEI